MIPIFEPYITGNEKKYLLECLETNWISSQGKFIEKFENFLAEYHGMKYSIVTSSGTTALHVALKTLDIGPGDEVICPALTFIAPANMIVLSGAELVLVDVNPQTLTIDPNEIGKKLTRKTKAIIVVHQFGHAAHIDEIMTIANKHCLWVVEDNAESIGGKYKGQLLGTIGDMSIFSFFGNKIITTGEGGAILTNDKDLAIKCYELRDHGMNHKKKYHHTDLGYNYRMTNMQAAIGLAQMEKLDEILAIRKKQMDFYYGLLDGSSGLTLRSYANWCDPVHWMMTITLHDQYDRNEFLNYMKQNGIDCRQMINPVHWADHFKDKYLDSYFPNAVSISKQSAHLPSSAGLSEADLETVVNTVRAYL